MKKNVFKIILDALMLVLLLLMYNVRAISSEFHEIGGIVLFGLFVLHMALNFKWITNTGGKLFSKTLPGRVRLKFIIDVLLFAGVALITVSGILISEVVFRAAHGGGAWKTVHYFASALTLILLGIHTGLNWAFIKNVIKLPRAVALPLGVILLAAILGFGGYSLVTSSFTGWIANPFTAGIAGGREFGGEGNFTLPDGTQGQFTPPGNGQAGKLPPGSGEAPQTGQLPPGNGEAQGSAQFGGNGKGLGQGGSQQFGQGGAQGLGQGRGPEASGGALGTLATYGSIAGVFAVITAFIDSLIRKREKQYVNDAKEGSGEPAV